MTNEKRRHEDNASTTRPHQGRFSLKKIASHNSHDDGRQSKNAMEPSTPNLNGSFKSRPRRVRQSSSMAGMFDQQADSDVGSPPSSPRPYEESQEELQGLARLLRRTKRNLLLKSVEQPSSPVDQLRSILLKIASDDEAFPSHPLGTPVRPYRSRSTSST